MAKAAEHFSDLVIVTSDNPRTEDPQAIIDGISAGFENPNKVKKIVDRREAIRYAIEVSQEDDIILIAGKGHEDYQIVGSQKLSFRDDMVAAEYLK
jgi:UDP-N-acetylmuramoyl-L-alanyl-D-glutamate--2,6-diaminopimelate ligase